MLQTFRKLKLTRNGKPDSGLTMIELLVTLAVIAIVAAITLPLIAMSIQRAQIDAYKGELNYVSDAFYKMVNGTFGEPSKAATNPTSNGVPIEMASLGPMLNDLGVTQGGSMLGYWFDISQMSLPFSTQNADALVIWDNSRIVRIVPYSDSNGTPLASADDVIVDACVTAWVGNANLVIPSLKSSNVVENSDLAPCGLIPGPIEAPGAPGAPQSLEPTGDGATSNMTVSLIDPPSNLGGDSADISITRYRVTCSDGNGSVTGVNATSTITVTGLTRGADYTCTAAVATNAYPGFGEESVASATIRIPEAPNAPTSLAGTGSGGQISLTWTAPTDDGCNEPGVDDGNTCGTGFALNDYEVQYILGTEGTDPATLTDTDFAAANLLATGTANTAYALSNTNINAYNAATSSSLPTLVDGSTYYVRVRAVNSVDLEGAWSAPIVEQTATEPDPITDAAGTDGVNQITIEFTVPYNGGLDISKYEVWYDIVNTYDGGGTTYTGPDGDNTPLGRSLVVCDDTGSANYSATICAKVQGDTISIVIDTLPDSTSYFVKIFTENPMGMSAWSNEVPVATYAPAEAPTATDASIDNSGNATVTWN